MCEKSEDCEYGMYSEMHAELGTEMGVYFEPQNLLVFLCQDLHWPDGWGKPDPSLVPNRFATNVTRADNRFSSYAMIEKVDDNSIR